MTSHTRSASFLLVILMLSSLSVAETRNRELSLTVVSRPYTIELVGEYHRITMEEFYTRGIPGYPVLPQQVYLVEVPYNCYLESVHLSILSQDSEEIPGLYEIGPSPFPGSGGKYLVVNEKNTKVYTKDALYPLSPVEMMGTSQVRDKKYVKVQFTPFQYNPVTKLLILNRKVTLSISWSTHYTAVPPLTAGTGYAIVTTNAIGSNSSNLNAFRIYLQRRGFTVHMVTENQYGAAQGQARALNIRNWLQANYLLHNIKYVLLIGNPDPDNPLNALDSYGDVPMMMCWPNPGNSADSTPTDYFYADLTGNWDSDNDSLYGEWGEDAVDFGPDVYVGRIPVYGNCTVLDTILTKLMSYTGANTKIMLPMAISNYQDEENGANGCVAGWGRTDGLNVPQEVITNIAAPAGFSSFVMYETAGVTGRGHDPVPISAYGYKAPLTNGTLMSEWALDYGIVFWWAHGSQTAAFRKYWFNDVNNNLIVEDGVCGSGGDELAWPNLLSSSDTAFLPDMETFVFQCSCLNGYPENSGNLQYSLLGNGAISTVGSTRLSWYSIGAWAFTGIADNVGIGYMYVGNLVFGQSAGEALYNGKSTLINVWGWMGWQNLFDFNLYGDPSLYLEKPILTPPPGGEPRPPEVNLTKVLCPLAKHRVEKARELLEDVRDLLQRAKDAGIDVSEIEEKIEEAEKLIWLAEKYCFSNNCIPGNYLALTAIETLVEVREKLNELLES